MVETQVIAFVVLLMVAAGAAVLVKLVPIPYVTVIAIIGVAAGFFLHAPQPLPLTHSFILFVLLPGLLFEAGFNLQWTHLRGNLWSVSLLATAGVILTAALVALLGHVALGLALPMAILFGAMVAPTDPVAVVAVFRRLHVPARLANLVEGESLLNDGTGVVLFTIALAAVAAGRFEALPAIWDFVRLSLGGLAFGAALGFIVSLLTARIDDPQVEITFTAVTAYGGYLLGETAHVSGILTVVAAAVVLGAYGRERGMSERTQQAVAVFWDYVAFVLNALVFLLIGLALPWPGVIAQGWVVLAAAVIVLVARAAMVYGTFGLLRPLGRTVNLQWQHVIVWSGIRGAVAVALALSLGSRGGQFGLVQSLVYGVALLTIVIQGLTITPLCLALFRGRSISADQPAHRR
jgi:CPA1 family monovalent cation:H+ antiporter